MRIRPVPLGPAALALLVALALLPVRLRAATIESVDAAAPGAVTDRDRGPETDDAPPEDAWDFDRDAVPDGSGPASGDEPAELGGPPTPDDPPAWDLSRVRQIPFGLDRLDHPALHEFLQYYCTEGRPRMARWISRSGRWRARIDEVIRRHDAPPELVWVAAIESSFTPDAVSWAGAGGMWQFMPFIATANGMRVDRWVDERFDPIRATEEAIPYLLKQYDRFGSWPVALAAYNAGSGHVRGQLRRMNGTDFWAMDRYGAIYTAARRYALRAITVAVLADNPEVCGMEGVVPLPAMEWDEVEVPGDTRLSLVALALDLSVEEVRALNPSLLANQTPPDVRTWTLRIPRGSHHRFVERFDDFTKRYGTTHQRAVLKFGQTVSALATEWGTTERAIRFANGIEPGVPVAYGTDLLIPVASRPAAETRRTVEPSSSRRGRRDRVREPAAPVLPVVLLPPTEFRLPDRRRVFYRANAWDRVDAIAAHFGVSRWDVAVWNDLDARAALFDGLILQLFVDPARDFSTDTVLVPEDTIRPMRLDSPEWVAHRASEEEAERKSTRGSSWTERRHKVVRGDTVGGIARRYGVRASDLIRWNRLGPNATIVIGQELIIRR